MAEAKLTFGVECFEADVQRDPTQAHGEAQPVQQTHAVPHQPGRQQQCGHFLCRGEINNSEKHREMKEMRRWVYEQVVSFWTSYDGISL